jgi:hypothetical protein
VYVNVSISTVLLLILNCTAGLKPGGGLTLLELQDATPKGIIHHRLGTIVAAAIWGTPTKKLSLAEIRMAISKRYPSIEWSQAMKARNN